MKIRLAVIIMTTLAIAGCESDSGGNCDSAINKDLGTYGTPSRTSHSGGSDWSSTTNYWQRGGGSYLGSRPSSTVAVSYYWGSAFDGDCERIYTSY